MGNKGIANMKVMWKFPCVDKVVTFASYVSLSNVKMSRLILHPFNKGSVCGKAVKRGSVL